MAQALLRFRKVIRPSGSRIITSGTGRESCGSAVEPIGFFLHTPWPAASVAVGVCIAN